MNTTEATQLRELSDQLDWAAKNSPGYAGLDVAARSVASALRVLAEQPEAEVIRAPFTAAQQQALYDWQALPGVHPFTCANCPDRPLAVGRHWYCPDCDYTQYWAHAFMARPPAVASTPDGPA